MAEAMLSHPSNSCLLNNNNNNSNNNNGTDSRPQSATSASTTPTKKNLSFASLPSTDSFRKKANSAIGDIISSSILSSNKRQRLQRPSQEMIKRVAEQLKTAISQPDRLSALGSACTTFDHDVPSSHDEEVGTYNVDAALCKHLALLIFQKRQIEDTASSSTNRQAEEKNESHNPNSADPSPSEDGDKQRQTKQQQIYYCLEEEIGYTCTALELVYRCTASTLKGSFERFGNELMDLLLYLLNMNMNENEQNNHPFRSKPSSCSISESLDSCEMSITNPFDHNSSSSGLSSSSVSNTYINKSTKILCHLARVGSATESMAHPRMLSTLQKIIDSGARSDPNKFVFHHEARANCLFCLANLACNPSNMVSMVRYPDMIHSVLEVVSRCSPTMEKHVSYDSPSSSRIRARNATECGQAVRFIMNLSWMEENKILFANMPEILEILIRLVSFKQRYEPSQRTAKVIKSIRSHAAGALRNIASAPGAEYKVRMLCHDESLLNILVETIAWLSLSNDSDDEVILDGDNKDVVEKCFATLYYLSCQETAKILGNHAGLLDQLRKAIAAGATTTDADGKEHVKKDDSICVLATRTMKILHQYASEDMKCHNGGLLTNFMVDNDTEAVAVDKFCEDVTYHDNDDMEPITVASIPKI